MTDKMKKPLIEAKNVSVILNYELILQNVNLEVFKGDTIVLIGPSGSGKTVLLKTLAGIYPPAEGYVKCHDLKWADMSLQVRHDFAKVLGMQFQKGALFDDLSAIDNLKYVLREHTTLSESEIETRSLDCLRMVNLEHARNLAPHELSGGMKLRLGVARALVLRPEIIFLDDPTAGLDPVSSDEMAKLILDIKQQIQATMVIVTHDISRAYQFAGRIFLVAGKTLFETGSASQTQNNSDPRIQQFLHGWINGPLTENIES